MRKGLLSSVATVLVGTGSALAQNPYYLPTDGHASAVPPLLSADATAPQAAPATPPALGCGSTGLVPGVDCLPAAVPSHPTFFGDASYMLAKIKDARSSGPLAIVAPSGATLFGPGTAAIIGGKDSSFDGQSGIRADIGMWLDCEGKIGVEAGGYYLQKATNGAAFSSDGSAGSPILARPFINADLVPPAPNAFTIAGPGTPGTILERETSSLWGYEANGILNWSLDCNRRTDLLAGFTYTDLHETLGVTSSTTFPGFAGPGFKSTFDDAFGTRNQFYAGQVGGRTTWTSGPLSLVMSGKIAVGVNHETVDRVGNSSFGAIGGVPTAVPTGFLVQSSNVGQVKRDQFAVGLPSQILVNYQVSSHLNAYIGYDFIYISSVARPGDQVDLVNLTNAANGNSIRPYGGIKNTDFWANSVLAGLAFNY